MLLLYLAKFNVSCVTVAQHENRQIQDSCMWPSNSPNLKPIGDSVRGILGPTQELQKVSLM